MPTVVPGRNGGKLHALNKGERKNPNGRPKGSRNTKTIIREILESMTTARDVGSDFDHLKVGKGDKAKMTVQEKLIYTQVMKAMLGDGQAFDRVFDRLEGKPTQEIQQTNLTVDDVLKKQDEEELIDLSD